MKRTPRSPSRCRKRVSRWAAAYLITLAGLACASAQTPWLNETFAAYTNGQAPTNSLSPQLVTQSGSPALFTTITNDSSTNAARYRKTTTGSGSQVMFALSATNTMTVRTNGYVSFKIKQNIDTNVPVANTFFMGIGNNALGTTISSSGSRLISIQFKQSGTPANTLSVESAGTTIVGTYSYANSTSFPRVQIWFNDSDTNSMSYTNPSGVATNLLTNSFVVYVDGVLVTTTNAGNAPLTGAAGTNLSIGKMGFGTGSTSTIDYSFTDLYADAAAPAFTNKPTITSATNASGYVGIPFSYQITTDPPGATSYAVSGTLPDGLAFNTTNGVISGTPTTIGGPTSVTLTASNAAGTGPASGLAISVGLPVNVFSGSNPSMNNAASWSLASTPTASANAGSFTDLVFNSTEISLTTSSGNVYGKSWNATNGSHYTFSSVAASNQTVFKLGNTGTNDTYPYSNSVAGAVNVLLFVTNGSAVTFSPANSGVGGTSSIVQLRNSGIALIAAGSLAEIQAPLSAVSSSNVLTKAGDGTLVLAASNSCAGGIVVSNGTVEATAAYALGAGALTVNGGAVSASADNAWAGSKALSITAGTATFASSNSFSGVTTLTGGTLSLSNSSALGATNTSGTFALAGGTVKAYFDYDLGHTYGTATNNGTNSWDKLNGTTTTIDGAVTLDVADGAVLGIYKMVGNTNASNIVTKIGAGTLQLRGAGATGIIADWLVNEGTLFVNTSSSTGLGSSNSIIMNGGNILFSKGVSSTGTYTGQGQDAYLQVRQNGTITLNPNPNTPVSNNVVSFTNLIISNQTLSVVKAPDAYCSTNPVGYTDPQLLFKLATLNGTAGFAIGADVDAVLQAGSGSGGVTKSGAGKLTVSANTNGVQSTYTGPTSIVAGTLAIEGSHASDISVVGGGTALELPLVASGWPTTAGSLTFAGGAVVRISGTPTNASYTLVTASNGISGTPSLETAIPGYQLAISNGSLILTSASAPAGYSAWLTNYPTLSNTNGTADPDADGFTNNLEYAFDGNPTAGTPALFSVAKTGTNAIFSFFASTNSTAVSYTVQSTTNLSLGPWSDNSSATGSVIDSTNQSNVPLSPAYVRREFSVPAAGSNTFYRVKALISE